MTVNDYDVAVQTDVPVARWKLADLVGSGIALDSTGGSHSGVATSVTFGDVAVPFAGESTASFGGASTVVTTFNPSGSSGITLEAWVNLNGNTVSGSPRVLANSHTDADNCGFELYYNSSRAAAISFGNGTSNTQLFSSNGAIPTSGWTYLAATWNGTTMRLYVNGVQAASGALSGSLALGTSNTAIGYDPSYSGDYVTGIISNCAVYSSALSVTRIAAHYAAFSSTTSSLLNGNLLLVKDSDFESGVPTWAAYTSANAPSVTSKYSFSGNQSLTWTANSTSDTIIATGYYPCTPNFGYDVSGYVLTPSASHDTYIGVNWFTSSHTLISTMWGNDNPSQTNVWQPLVAGVTSPSNAAFMEVTVWVGTGVVNTEPFAIDLMFVTDMQGAAAVWIDWQNPTFTAGSIAGTDFVDMTPWVRLDQNINMTHGRQDAISEVQAGQATFFVQNDMGWFTPNKSTSPYFPNIGLGARCQINAADENGVINTRYDGAVSEITYDVDETGDTNLAAFSCSDVLAYLNRQKPLSCWTKQTVLADNPAFHWTLNDTGLSITTSESSSNNGPPLRSNNYNTGGAIAWADTTAGVETLSNAAAPNANNGASFWTVGSDVPNSPVRGLVSGVVGPTTTPLPNILLTPAFTAQSGQNYFSGTDGYQLSALLAVNGVPTPMNTATGNYSVESYFCMSPTLLAQSGKQLGPFAVFSLGSTRQSPCFVAGVFLSGSNFLVECASYSQPPAFPVLSTGVAPPLLSNVTTPIAAIPNVVHHLVATFAPASTGATVTLWLDGTNQGTMTLTAGQYFDTICIGGTYGGHGNFAGSISTVSIYNYQLSLNQINMHAMVGEYGMWEQPTDNCIAELGLYAGLPLFWNNLTATNNGLSLTEYYNITGASPLSSMQAYEQTEHGLLYVNLAGQLTFHTRDWRMGYGAPDVVLAASTYDADLGYELVDTYLLNEAATATAVFSSGVDWVAAASQAEYGNYTNGTLTSPIQLPLITWSRGYAGEGLTQAEFWPTPNLDDNAAWQVFTRSNPRLIPGSITIDLLTMEPAGFIGGLAISVLYALDTDNMMTVAGLPSASFPDQTGVNDYFIEGINEVIGVGTRKMTFYVSPANVQRAWQPGDATYGLLGTTSRLGISAPDTNQPPALGKQVSHDGGPPYWPPDFETFPGATQIGFTNATATSPVINPTSSSVQGDCLMVQIIAPAASTITVADNVNTGNYTNIGQVTLTGGVTQYLFAYFNALPLNTATAAVTITTTTSQAYTTSLYRIWGVTAVDHAAVTATGTSVHPAVTGGTMANANDFELVVITNNTTQQSSIPSGWSQLWWNYAGIYQNQLFCRQATSTAADSFTGTIPASDPWGAIAISFTVSAFFMNNPSQNGHAFVGANDIRGIRETLSTCLQPPLLVLGQIGFGQTYTTGNNNIAGRMVWNSVYVDTAGGMGLVPGWSNWYVVTVPGWYEISGQNQWAAQASGAVGIRVAWIIVAMASAAGVAAGTYTPYTAPSYACPIGEIVAPNSNSKQTMSCPITRIYLGVGDMVSLGSMQTQGSSINTGNGIASGSWFSMRWVGYGTLQDQYPTCGLPGGGVTTSQPSSPSVYTTSWRPTHTYAYLPTQALKNTDGTMTQGTWAGGPGAQYAAILWPYAAIATALSGATISSVQITLTNGQTAYSTGAAAQIGTSPTSVFGGTYNPFVGNVLNAQELWFTEGHTQTFYLSTWFGTQLQSGAAKSFILGNGSTNLKYYSLWTGGTGGTSPKLTITYTK